LLDLSFQGANRIEVFLQFALVLFAQFPVEGLGLVHDDVQNAVVSLEALRG
jgi:hypothetical protein